MTRSARAFTLIELLVVVAILGLIATTIVGSVGRTSPARQREQALGSLRDALVLTRVEALQRQEAREVVVAVREGRLTATSGDRERSWAAPSLRITTDGLGEDDARRVRREGTLIAAFGPAGRTPQRRWVFDDSVAGGTIWDITFDPISSAPSLARRD